MEMGKQTSWMINKPIFSINATLQCLVITNWQTNQLDKKQTNFSKTANLLCLIIGNGQTNQLDEKQTNFAIDATILYMIIGNE